MRRPGSPAQIMRNAPWTPKSIRAVRSPPVSSGASMTFHSRPSMRVTCVRPVTYRTFRRLGRRFWTADRRPKGGIDLTTPPGRTSMRRPCCVSVAMTASSRPMCSRPPTARNGIDRRYDRLLAAVGRRAIRSAFDTRHLRRRITRRRPSSPMARSSSLPAAFSAFRVTIPITPSGMTACWSRATPGADSASPAIGCNVNEYATAHDNGSNPIHPGSTPLDARRRMRRDRDVLVDELQ